MLLSISWRNVWRSKLRSGVMTTAIALGVCAGIFSSAFYNGMAVQRIEKGIKTEIGHIQIHRPEFRESNEIGNYIPGALEISERIRRLGQVEGVSARIVIFSMISSAETGSGIKIVGVEPDAERRTSNLHTKLTEGTFFGEEYRRNVVPIVIGQKLAEKLKVKMGSKVVVTLQDVDNNITAGAFRVVGLFNTVNNNYDEGHAFVRYSDLAGLTGFPEGAGHEITIYASSNEAVPELMRQIEAIAAGQEVMAWNELSPELGYLNDFMDLYMYIFIIIILIALLFGIVNTMLMAILERVKEIGMLMAIGMNKLRIFTMIILEATFLSLSGGIVGIGLGIVVSKYFEHHPIDLSVWGEVYADLGYDSFVYTSLKWPLLFNVTLLVLLTGVLASIYPAWRALQNDPADALRME
jgi:putative ABC transport system permease protein